MKKYTYKKFWCFLLFSAVSYSVQAADTFFITQNGVELGNGPSYSPSISADGNKIIFESTAGNLINDGISKRNVYLYDIVTNQFERLSVSNSGTAGNKNSLHADISHDGTLAVFDSFSNNLADNSGGKGNVFLRDIVNKTTILVSKTYDGNTPNGASSLPQISGDGRYVVFHSKASNLALNDTNGLRDIFVYDVINNTVQKVSTAHDGSITNGDSNTPSISNDGRFITYISVANNIDLSDDNNKYDVFLWDRQTGTSKLVTKTYDGTPLVANNRNPYISGNGKYIAFISDAKNLVPNTNATFRHLFLYDVNADSISLISRSTNGVQANNANLIPRISDNCRFISYVSKANNLVDNDSNNSTDLFVYDSILKTTERVNLTNAGQELNANVDFVSAINDNGQILAFATSAPNLGSNNHTQITLRFRDPIPNLLPVADAGTDQTLLCGGTTTGVLLDGTQSHDPDLEQQLTYNWTGSFGTSNLVSPLVFLETGTHNINLQVFDDAGATNSDDVLIAVNDVEPPVINSPSLVTLEATSVLGAHHSIPVFATDNCSSPTTSISMNDTWFPLGLTSVTISAIDNSSNTTTSTSTVQVQDTTAPSIIAPANVVHEATGIQNMVNFGVAVANDIFPVTISNNAPITFALGATDVAWTAVDANGNAATAIQNVQVLDTTAPVISLSDAFTVEASSVDGTPFNISYSISDSCNCGIITTTFIPELSIYPLGATLVEMQVADASGNIAKKTTTIQVVDTTPPQLSVPADVVVEATSAEMQITIGQATADDVFPVTISNDAPTVFNIGTTNVTWTAVDANGNKVTAIQSVLAQDTTPPVINMDDVFTVEATDPNGTPFNINYEISDSCNCGLITSVFVPDLATYPLGTTQVELQVTDANGNVAKKMTTIHVADTTSPQITLPADITVEATSAAMQVTIGQATADDIFPVTVSNNTLPSYSLGTHFVTWTATDSNGNKSTAVQQITVKDTTSPTLNAGQDVTLEATSTQGAEFTLSYQVTDTCNCGTTNIDIKPSLSVYPLGKTSVVINATDQSGNKSTDTVVITVVDSTKPVLSLPLNIVNEATGSNTSIAIGNATATDIFPVTITNNALTSFPLGKTLVTWTATDSNGNSTIQLQEITIIDTTAPTFEIIETGNRMWPPNRKLEHVLTVKQVNDLVDITPVLDINIAMNIEIKQKHKHHRQNKPFWDVKKIDNGWEVWLKKTKKRRSRENLIYTISVTATDDFGNVETKENTYEVKHTHKSHRHSKKWERKHKKADQDDDDDERSERIHRKAHKDDDDDERSERRHRKAHKDDDDDERSDRRYRKAHKDEDDKFDELKSKRMPRKAHKDDDNQEKKNKLRNMRS